MDWVWKIDTPWGCGFFRGKITNREMISKGIALKELLVVILYFIGICTQYVYYLIN